jgi:ankyrin repeat protein
VSTRFLNALALVAGTLGAGLAAPGALAAQAPDRPARAVTVPATRPQAVAPGSRTAPPAGAVAEAAQRGDLATVRQLLARGGDVNAAQGDGMTALHWAADRGDSALAGALLQAKADVSARTRIGNYTPLHLAARTGNPATVRALLAAGGDVDAPTVGGATALHLASTAGNADVVRALLARGANANAREAVWGQTPLVFAAERDRAAAITALIAGGADPSIRTSVVNLTEQEAREQAAQKKRNAVLIAFEPKARRDSADADHKRAVDAAKAQLAQAQAQLRTGTAVPAAVPAAAAAPQRRDSAPATATAVLGAQDPGTLVNAQNPQAALGFLARLPVREPRGPFTPEQIQIAIDSGRMVLLAKAVSTDSVREQVDTANGGVAGYTKQVGSVGGLTALHHAARQGSVAAALALIEGGAKLNDTTFVDRMTPLMMAAVNGQFDVAKLLVERGADPNVVTTYGMSPLYATLNAQWAPRSRYPQPQAIQTQQTSYVELPPHCSPRAPTRTPA